METRITLRLPTRLAAQLEAVAWADQVTVTEAARTAIREHVDRRLRDEGRRNRIRRILGERYEALRRLVG